VDVGDLLVELGAVVLGLAVLAPLAIRAGVSPIPLYLILGVALGQGGLYELGASEAFVQTGAQVGVVLLLLMLGLEYSPAELAASVRGNLPAGVVDLVLNAAPGLAAGALLGLEPLAVMALAGVTYISSSSIVAKLLSDLGRLGNRETPTILSILVLEDLAMAVYLPLLGTLLVGISLASASIGVLVAVAAVGGVLAVSVRLGPRLSGLVFSPDNEQLLLRVLGLTLLVAGVADHLGVSAAVGAFLVGLGLSGQTADSARAVLARCVTCSRRSSSSPSGSASTRVPSFRCCPSLSCWPSQRPPRRWRPGGGRRLAPGSAAAAGRVAVPLSSRAANSLSSSRNLPWLPA
jgi:CPA2 family monovalent cation:H+ antiporter-2